MSLALERQVESLQSQVDDLKRIHEHATLVTVDGTETMIVSKLVGGEYIDYQVDPSLFFSGKYTTKTASFDLDLSHRNTKIRVNGNTIAVNIPNDLGWQNGDSVVLVMNGTGFTVTSGASVSEQLPQAIQDVENSKIVITKVSENIFNIIQVGISGGGGVSDHGALTGLSDDDHTQYHTDARADTWLVTKNKADKSNVLELDNTTSYTPSLDYHPATKKYVDDNSSGSISTVAKTGTTIVFTENADYNFVTPLTTEDITLDATGAVAGVEVAISFDGTSEPAILGGVPIELTTGFFAIGRKNIYRLRYNTNSKVEIAFQPDNREQLLPPASFSALVVSGTELDLSWNAVTNATNYILERGLLSDYSDAVQIYTGATVSYSDTGLTESTLYYYRVKAQDSGLYLDSDWSETSATPISTNLVSFTTVGFTESPVGTFQNTSVGNYGDAYGVSAQIFTGARIYTIDVDDVITRGGMIGLSTTGANNSWNTGTAWSIGMYINNTSSAIITFVNGSVVTASPGATITYGVGDVLTFERDGSNNVVLNYNGSLVHDFGTPCRRFIYAYFSI